MRRQVATVERLVRDNPPFTTRSSFSRTKPRKPLLLDGGTRFTFVTEGIETALDAARRAAGGRIARSPVARIPHASSSQQVASTR
jgi:hypothetical protein